MVDAPRLSRQGFAAFALIWLTAVARPASGQTTEATRAAARQLATEGVAKFEEGEFVSASDKLGRAFETIRAPSLGLWSARALVRCGRLVEGGERYLEVTRLDPKTGDEAVQRQAQSDAIHEYDALQSRIPRLTLALSNSVPDQDLRVTLDGVLLPATLLRAQVPVDPGPHVIEAVQGALSARQAVTFAEGAPFTGEMVQREHMQFYPGERANQSMPRLFFNPLCGGCHGSVSGRELDTAADIDVLTEASRHVQARTASEDDLTGL